ncbi:hypothetical protein [Prescottella equi]|uniref:hypothetical protein n=1 Tax=Rhodococcus hoagii TaxID=43767 RepID=UPI0007CD6FF5|nr:hypothetical protein [Prescottella equi]ORL01550.1 hypothetical protein A6F56_04315 [Prescottella equi]
MTGQGQWNPGSMTWPWPDPRDEQIRGLVAENKRLREQLDALGVGATADPRKGQSGDIREHMLAVLHAVRGCVYGRHFEYYIELARRRGFTDSEVAEALAVPIDSVRSVGAGGS